MNDLFAAIPEILVVEPDADDAALIERLLGTQFQTDVRVVESGEAAIESHLNSACDIVLATTQVPDMHFSALAGRLIAVGHPRFVLLTDEPDGREMIQAIRAGVHDAIVKPIDAAELTLCVEQQFEWRLREIKARRRTRKARTAIMKRDLQNRALQERVDLLSKDITAAYARLAEKLAGGKAGCGD